MCLIINHFIMYYSNPQVNYMVTVFIRLVTAVVYTLYLLSCSKCFVCLCLFQYRHCFLVGWCTNKSYVIATSDLWLFIHASNLLPSTPHPRSPTTVFQVSFCNLTKAITPKMRVLCFVLTNSVLLNLLCIWILFQNASSHSCFIFYT